MRLTAHINEPVGSLLDVGCNVGAWLEDCAKRFPQARLCGVEINATAVKQAIARVPNAEVFHTGAESLPFPDATFQYVTCVEVLEHLPKQLRPIAFQEMRRVLQPGGRLILTVPHAGWFAWLDSNNLRFRLPAVYRRLVGKGGRDANYAAAGKNVEWHHHFTVSELDALAGPGWHKVAVQHGGLILFPLMDLLSWPFYRWGKARHPIRQFLERIAEWDYRINYRNASYGVLVVLERSETKPTFPQSPADGPVAISSRRTLNVGSNSG